MVNVAVLLAVGVVNVVEAAGALGLLVVPAGAVPAGVPAGVVVGVVAGVVEVGAVVEVGHVERIVGELVVVV
ncbi:hypothetical protein, partial [Microtetraspora glauca]